MQPLDYAGPEFGPMPVALRVVAWIFIGTGIASVVATVARLIFHEGLVLDPNTLSIWTGLGLLGRKSGWRTYAIVWLWIIICASALATIDSTCALALPHKFASPPPRSTVCIILLTAVVICGVAIWCYRVLTCPEVRALFFRLSPQSATPEELDVMLKKIT